jgi:heme-degrading monooxygenase HmoA
VILEHALLRVRDGECDAFETAMTQAKLLIAASPGFRGIEVRPAVETPSLYLLLVQWDDVASHRDGFRKSERYAAWRALLHRFYEPMPEVAYFDEPIDV